MSTMVYNPFLQRDVPNWLYPQIKAFDTLRGTILHLWAGVESSMDQANHYAWHYSGKTVSKAVPQSLRWKVELFEGIHTSVLPFEALKSKADALLPQIKALFEDRHWMAHGMMLPKKCDAETWLLMKHEFVRGDGGLKVHERRFTRPEMEDIRMRLVALGMEMASYLDALLNEFMNHRLNDGDG